MTLTLDDDVGAMLQQIRRERRARVKAVVNEALRQGLRQMIAPPRRHPLCRTPSVSLGRRLVGNLDDVAEALAAAEGEVFR